MTAGTETQKNRSEVVAFRRIYAGPDGHSHFADVLLDGREQQSDYSDLRAFLGNEIPVKGATFRLVVVETDSSTPHNAPYRQLVVMLRGQCEVVTSLGDVWMMNPGDVLLVEDMEGKGHITRRIGIEERLTMLVTLDN